MKEQKQQHSTKPIKLIFLAVALFATGAFNSRGQVTTSIAQQDYIKASNTGGPSRGETVLDKGYGDNFGWSVAISGDTMVIGALGEDSKATGVNGNQTNNNALNSGAVYVFVRSGTNWIQQAYLKASNTGAGDEFGRSVAISGDTIVVGGRGLE